MPQPVVCRTPVLSLAEGFLRDRCDRPGRGRPTAKEELARLFQASLTVHYRLLLLLLAEARQLGPAPSDASDTSDAVRLTEAARQIAAVAGNDPRRAGPRIAAAFSETGHDLWDRLTRSCAALGPVPLLRPDENAFLPDYRVGDRFLAAAIDALARQWDPATERLEAVDFRTMDIRRLGAIHEELSQCKLAWVNVKGTVPFSSDENRDSPPRCENRGSPRPRCRLDLLHNKAGRKAAGSYYTPEPIVRQIVEHTIGPMLDRKFSTVAAAVASENILEHLLDFRVLDPAMGSGYFLLTAADFITGRLEAFLAERSAPVSRSMLKRRVVERCLYGIDLDPLAVELAKASLWLDIGPEEEKGDSPHLPERPATNLRSVPGFAQMGTVPFFQLDQHLRCGDALVGDTLDNLAGGAGFDVVLGNPPYRGVRTGTIDRALADYVTKRYTAARRNWDLAAVFLERSLAVAKKESACGFIVPSRIGTNRDFAALRDLIFAAGGPDMVIDCGPAFDDTAVLASIVTVVRPPLSCRVRLGRLDGAAGRPTWELPRAVLQSLPDRPLFTTLRAEEAPALERLASAPCRLGQLADIVRGMECGTSDPHIRRSPRAGWLPVISGRSVHEFRIEPQGLFIRPGLRPASKYKRRELFETVPKLLVRFVAPHPVAAVDLLGWINCNTVYNILLHRPSADAYAALACLLNSRPVRWWFTRAFNSQERLFPHIQKYQLEQIPLPVLDAGNRHIAELSRLGHAAARQGAIDWDGIHAASLAAFGQEGHVLLSSKL